MVDLTKRVSKHGTEMLQPGEIVLGALQLIPPTGLAWGAAGGATGGVLGAVVGIALDARKQRKEEARKDGEDQPPEAAKFPAGGSVIAAVTDRRLVFFTMTAGRGLPKEILLEIPHSELSLQRRDDKKTAHLRFVCGDGSVFDTSALIWGPNKKNAEGFFAALEQKTGGSS